MTGSVKKWVCDMCGLVLDNAAEKKLHEKVCWKRQECGKCMLKGCRFENQEEFRQHEKYCIGRGLYECKHCAKKFHVLKNIVEHVKVCSERPKCSICGEQFESLEKRTCHYETKHKLMYCSWEGCGFSSPTVGELKVHQAKIHNG